MENDSLRNVSSQDTGGYVLRSNVLANTTLALVRSGTGAF
jgi:hypothetical protein